VTAFNTLKHALCSKPLVNNPRKNGPYSLIVDACTGNDKAIGGMGAKHEKNYTPFLVEMAAMIWAMEHFDTYLRGSTLLCSVTTNL
jgi:hypothetical protein